MRLIKAISQGLHPEDICLHKGNPLKKLERSIKKTIRKPSRLVSKPVKETRKFLKKVDDEVTRPVAKKVASKLLPDKIERELTRAAHDVQKAKKKVFQAGEDITDKLAGKDTDAEAEAKRAYSAAAEEVFGAPMSVEEESADDDKKKKKRRNRTRKSKLKIPVKTVSGAGLKA